MTTPTTGAPRGVPTDADIQQVLADSVGDKIWQAPWLTFARAVLVAFAHPVASGWQPIETASRDRVICRVCGGMCPRETRNTRAILAQASAITALEAELAALWLDAKAKQAKIDQLMLEYCPSEMTREQLEEWGAHQTAADEPMKGKV